MKVLIVHSKRNMGALTYFLHDELKAKEGFLVKSSRDAARKSEKLDIILVDTSALCLGSFEIENSIKRCRNGEKYLVIGIGKLTSLLNRAKEYELIDGCVYLL